jgi:ribosomal protein S18 acetylase RimI-like enzyme
LLQIENSFAGCVGLREITSEIAEMKRLYIRKEFRGKGLSRELIAGLFSAAKKMNYKAVRLDTLPQMKEAISLYQSLGFTETTPYRFNPVEGTKYMELKFE